MISSAYLNYPMKIKNISLELEKYNKLVLVNRKNNSITQINYNDIIHNINNEQFNIIYNNSSYSYNVISKLKYKKLNVNFIATNFLKDNLYEGFFIDTVNNSLVSPQDGTVFNKNGAKIIVISSLLSTGYKIIEVDFNDMMLFEPYFPSYIDDFSKQIILNTSNIKVIKHYNKNNSSNLIDFDYINYNHQKIESNLLKNCIINRIPIQNYVNAIKKIYLKTTNDLEKNNYPISYYNIDNSTVLNEIIKQTPFILGLDTLVALETNYCQISKFYNCNDIIHEKYTDYLLANKTNIITNIPIYEYDKYILNGYLGYDLTYNLYKFINDNDIKTGIFGQILMII